MKNSKSQWNIQNLKSGAQCLWKIIFLTITSSKFAPLHYDYALFTIVVNELRRIAVQKTIVKNNFYLNLTSNQTVPRLQDVGSDVELCERRHTDLTLILGGRPTVNSQSDQRPFSSKCRPLSVTWRPNILNKKNAEANLNNIEWFSVCCWSWFILCTRTVGTCQYSGLTIYGYSYSLDPDPAL